MKVTLDMVRLQAYLVAREELPLRYAALMAMDVAADFDERLLPAVQDWMDGRLTADFAVEDCSLEDIMEDTDASLFEALCMLNVQLKRPEMIEQVTWVLRGDDAGGIV